MMSRLVHITQKFFVQIIARIAKSYNNILVSKTYLRPYKSAILGIMKAADPQPIKISIPINPNLALLTHCMSSYCTQLLKVSGFDQS